MIIIISILVSIAAFTFSEILTEPGMILFALNNYVENTLPGWLYKPLIGCSKCVAGQWALWLFPFYLADNYDVIIHCWFVLQTIFNAAIISRFFYKLNVPKQSVAPLPDELKSFKPKL